MRERARERVRVWENDDGWVTVSPRRRKATRPGDKKTERNARDQKYHGRTFKHDTRSEGMVPCYFTNIPDDCSVEDLWLIFLRKGKAQDVYIPMKLSKFGKRFGFVQFRDVFNPRELEKSLNQIWLGTYKLRANMARFQRPTQGNLREEVSPDEKKAVDNTWKCSTRVKGLRYADVV